MSYTHKQLFWFFPLGFMMMFLPSPFSKGGKKQLTSVSQGIQ